VIANLFRFTPAAMLEIEDAAKRACRRCRSRKRTRAVPPSMNFFEHQQRARQRTTLAVLLFIVATLAVVAPPTCGARVCGVPERRSLPVAGRLHQLDQRAPRAILWTA